MYNILCIGDASMELTAIDELFKSNCDLYNLLTTSTISTMDILTKQSVDLILLNINISEVDGFSIAKLIKQNDLLKNIPIIFLTDNKNDEIIKKAFLYGVDYLSKPYTYYELFQRVKVQLEHIESRKKLNEQILFTQSILDSQKHIIFIQSEDQIISANKRFLDFFKISDIAEFKKSHHCIAELFMEYENYFSLHVLNSDRPWVVELSTKKNNKNYNVLILDIENFEPKAFNIDINKIDDSNKYVVVLSDITDMTTKTKQFENKATYDALTHIYNRSKFNDIFKEEIKIAKFEGHDLSFAILDIDFFKKVNDNYGHIVGDKTLIKFASTIQKHIRSVDTFARWGGEEFVLILVGTNEKNAFKVVNNLRKTIEETEFAEVNNITCSIGITQLKECDKIDEIIKRADEALYIAKETGRNKVCIK